MFYEVIPTEVFRNGSGTLTYTSDLKLKPGHLVVVPLGKKTIIGIIWRKLTTAEAKRITFQTKPIKKLLLPVPLPAHLLAAMPWLAEYYLSPLPVVANSVLPAGLTARGAFNCLLPRENSTKTTTKDLAKPPQTSGPKSKEHKKSTNILAPTVTVEPNSKSKGRLGNPTKTASESLSGSKSSATSPETALKKENIELPKGGKSSATNPGIAPKSPQNHKAATSSHDGERAVLKLPLIPLNLAQKNALQSLAEAPSYTRLLRGVTGSGKTNLYLKLVADAFRQQKSTILLVPEIALTSQLVKVFQQTFGDRVVLIHSNQTLAERREVWLKLLFSGQNTAEILETIRIEEERAAQQENGLEAANKASETSSRDSTVQQKDSSGAANKVAGVQSRKIVPKTGVVRAKSETIGVVGTPKNPKASKTGSGLKQNPSDLTKVAQNGRNSSTVAESVRFSEAQTSLFVNSDTPKLRRKKCSLETRSPFDVLFPLTLEKLCGIIERDSSEPLVVIGPRSALFAPLQNLGQIIIDEAHEGAYYQENTPRYSALRLASLMASRAKIPCLLGSATPNVVDYHLAKCKKSLVELNEKAKTTAKEPDFTVIDCKKRELFYNNRYFSTPLIVAMRKNLEQHHQTLIFHNRRGSAPLTICEDCGWQALCPTCYLPMTLHADGYVLTCHICGHEEKVPSSCPNCHHAGILHKGFGTKLLETELQGLFPQAKIARFDGDNKKGGDLASKYNEVKRGAIDILIGTQTLARGLDLPHLATVGVVQADAGLALPDFAAEERAFELLTQVFGRVGRGHLDQANVFIQTYQPDHPVIRSAISADFLAFADYLLKKRRAQFLPPFCYLARLAITYKTEKTTLSKIRAAHAALNRVDGLVVSPPMPAFHERTGRGYTWQLILKSSSRETLRRALLPFSAYHIELDPPSLL